MFLFSIANFDYSKVFEYYYVHSKCLLDAACNIIHCTCKKWRMFLLLVFIAIQNGNGSWGKVINVIAPQRVVMCSVTAPFLGIFPCSNMTQSTAVKKHSITFTPQVKYMYVCTHTYSVLYTYISTHTYTEHTYSVHIPTHTCTYLQYNDWAAKLQQHVSQMYTLYTAPTSSLQRVCMYAHTAVWQLPFSNFHFIPARKEGGHRCYRTGVCTARCTCPIWEYEKAGWWTCIIMWMSSSLR